MLDREKMIEAMADGIEVRLGPVFGSPEYLADPIKLARAEKRRRDAAVSHAQAALTALEALGCVVVPVEPTEAMIEAHSALVCEARLKQTLCPRAAYAAMLAASPLHGREG